MAHKSVWTLLLLASVCYAQSTYCPKFVCSFSLGRNICANRLTSRSYQLNEDGCEEDYYCTAAGVYKWVDMSQPTTSSTGSTSFPATSSTTYHCVPVPHDPSVEVASTWTGMTCVPRQVDRDFKNGETVVTCTSDNDCALRDGSYTTCQCVFRPDGYGICKPDINNIQIFQGYWDECGSSMTITNEDQYNYWMQYLILYPVLMSAVNCIDIFKEVQDMQDLNSAVVLAAAALIALA